MKIAVSYVRVSTNKQDIRGSKLGQEQEIKKFAKKEKYNIIASFNDTEHGDIADRTGLNDLKQYLRSNSSVEYVIVYHSDRFTRNFQNGMQDLFFLDSLEIKLISVMEGEQKISGSYDSLPTIVRLIGTQEDKDKMVKKVTTAMYQYAETARYLGGSIYPWFDLEKGFIDGKKCKIIVKNNETWDFYRRFFLEIIRSRNINRSCEKFSINYATAQTWLSAPELIGKRSFGKKGKINKFHKKGRREEFLITENSVFPNLLTQEEFNQLLSLRNKNNIRFKENTRVYIYSQVLYCSCGGKYEGNFIRKKDKENKGTAYYSCSKCKRKINAKKIEKVLVNKICDDKRLKMINEIEFRLADLFDEKNDYEKQVALISDKERRVIHLVSDGITSMDVVETELRNLKKQKEHFKNLIQKLENVINEESNKEITEENIKMLKELLNINSDDSNFRLSLKEIINLLVRKIVISNTDDKIYLYF